MSEEWHCISAAAALTTSRLQAATAWAARQEANMKQVHSHSLAVFGARAVFGPVPLPLFFRCGQQYLHVVRVFHSSPPSPVYARHCAQPLSFIAGTRGPARCMGGDAKMAGICAATGTAARDVARRAAAFHCRGCRRIQVRRSFEKRSHRSVCHCLPVKLLCLSYGLLCVWVTSGTL